MSRNWNPFKKENTPDSLINENTATPFECYHCTSGKYPRYYPTHSEYVRHMIDEHPEEWPLLIKTSLQKPKWIQHNLTGGDITPEQQKDVRAAYIKTRATSDVGVAVYVTAGGAASYNRVDTLEPQQYTHVRAMNHAMKVSGRNQGCIRSILNGTYGPQGKALLGQNASNNKDKGIHTLTNKALDDIKNLRQRHGLAGNGNILQLDEKYPEDKLSKMKVFRPTTSNNLEPTTDQLKAQFLNGGHYADMAMEQDPNATKDMQYRCRICNGFFNVHGRSPHWKLGCIPVTETVQGIADTEEELTIPTAVVDIPDVKDNSSFWDLVDNKPEMNWNAFSETLGDKVWEKYLTLEDEIKQLTTANQDLGQEIEKLTISLAEKTEELELYLAINDSATPPKNSDEEQLPSNKAEVLQGIQNAGRASAQEILRKYTEKNRT